MFIPNSRAQDLEKILPPTGIMKSGEAGNVQPPQGGPTRQGIEGEVQGQEREFVEPERVEEKPVVGIEEKEEMEEREEIGETVPESYTRSVSMPRIEGSEEPSTLELLFLGKISEEKQVLKQYGYDLFKRIRGREIAPKRRDIGKTGQGLDSSLTGAELADGQKNFELLSVIPPTGFDKNYILAPGDVIQIFLSGEGVNIYLARVKKEELEAFLPLYPLPIDPEGKIYYPPVGTVYLWGKSIGNAETYLKSEIKKYIKDVQVSISLREVRAFPVIVVGEVESPGTVYVNALSSVIDALTMGGGVKKTGSLRTIFVNRNDKRVTELDIYELLFEGKRETDILLKDRDVVVVPPIGKTAAVWGMVKRPGIFEIIEGENISDLLSFAGGVLPGANTSSMKLTTHVPEGKKVIKEVKIGSREIFPGDGDVFTVIPLADELKEFVELKGHVKNPGFYQWRKGMRVKEIIGSEDNFLPEGLFNYAEIVRRKPPDYTPAIISFNPLRAIEESLQDDIEVMAGDIITLFSIWDFKKKPFVRIEGEVEEPGRYRWVQGMTVRDLIRSSGGLTRASRMDEAELWRYELEGNEYLLKFNKKLNLEKVLEGRAEDNPGLMSFDQVVIKGVGSYGQLNWKMIVKGEVSSPGTFPVRRGERISDIIERAGGFSEFAYSRGIVLLRKSVERLQRKRLEVLITDLESRLFKEEASSAFGTESGELAVRRQVLEGRKSLLRVMREKMELVVGRVVVDISGELEELRGTDRDIELEDGDELYVPFTPSYVLMLGDVFNQVGLTYKSENKLDDYLFEVGGLTRNADKKGVYVIRADGTVVSNEMNQFLNMVHWYKSRTRFARGGIYIENIYPGDTIVVPTETKFPIPWRPLIRDITQIIFQAISTVAIIDNLGD
jgi:protein involved in polysaccharide export with SLBB domain